MGRGWGVEVRLGWQAMARLGFEWLGQGWHAMARQGYRARGSKGKPGQAFPRYNSLRQASTYQTCSFAIRVGDAPEISARHLPDHNIISKEVTKSRTLKGFPWLIAFPDEN